MKITQIGIVKNNSISLVIGKGNTARAVMFPINENIISQGIDRPTYLKDFGENLWIYKNKLFYVNYPEALDQEEIVLRIKHHVLKADRDLKRMARELDALENIEKSVKSRRERIPDNVRLFVWQRDEGKCVKCGSKEKLEFDHIIPVIEGGSNTERNIQLLCDQCNRNKGKSI